MNYNFIAECESKGIDSKYFYMLDLFDKKYDFKPGCIEYKDDAGRIIISNKDISILIQRDENEEISKIIIRSDMVDPTCVGYFSLILYYRDNMDEHLEVPMVSFRMLKDYGYLVSENGLKCNGICVDYYDNLAVSYSKGNFKKYFIEPDASCTVPYDVGVEKTLAGLVCGLYDSEIKKNIEKPENKVYCKLIQL